MDCLAKTMSISSWGISNIYTVMNNELGFYPTYKTDKFGFNNSNTNYENEIEYLLIEIPS